MTLPINQLTKSLSTNDVKGAILDLLTTSGLPVSSWYSGSVVRTIIETFSSLFADWSVKIADLTKSGFLDLAESFWLTLLAYYVYGVSRNPPSFATGFLTLTNSGGAIYSIDAEDLVFVNTNVTPNVTYTNTSSFVLNGNTSITIPIRATEEGKASSADPNEIDQLVTKLLNVTCTNALSVLGSDEESDANLRQRCRDALGALSPNGPQAAYEYFAKSTLREDGSLIEANRVKVSPDSSTGVVLVYLADSDGILETADVNLIDANIQNNVVPIAVTCIVDNAVPKEVNIIAAVKCEVTINITTQSLTDNITDSLNNLFSNYPIGGLAETAGGQGYLWLDAIEGAIMNANPSIFSVDLSVEYLAVPIVEKYAMNTNDVMTYTIDPGDLTIQFVPQ